jgi:DNA modification methylase
MGFRLYRPAPRASLIEGDAREALRKFAENRFDSCVTDGPYELGFMGKAWDRSGIVNDPAFWREVLRVLKPGAHLLSFGGTRTSHRMVCAIEDAGFEIRDSLHWFYGTGFPKSKTEKSGMPKGQGTALKPGHEPICMARKPLDGTIAKNIAKWGTGGLAIDTCRIGTMKSVPGSVGATRERDGWGMQTPSDQSSGFDPNTGRWPANVLLDEDAAAELDAQSGETGARAPVRGTEPSAAVESGTITNARARVAGAFHADSGGASRFFYVAKPSRRERDQGCAHLPAVSGGEATDRADDSKGTQNPRAGAGRNGGARNFHPTVKPVSLMRYLVRLVTPLPTHNVLDPFAGSGTTGVGALLERRDFVGMELTPAYVPIATARIADFARYADGEIEERAA